MDSPGRGLGRRHTLALFAAKRDPDFAPVLMRTCARGGTCHAEIGEYRKRADRLADHLPWAALVARCVVLNKDGSFTAHPSVPRPDLESATESELVSVSAG
jgi:hypothetical protein